MDATIVVARILHIGLGVFWAGSVLFSAIFLDPAVRSLGPSGGQVMGALAKRRFAEIMIGLGVLTILSGVYLMWRVSAGFSPEWTGSRAGMLYSIGALAAIAGLAVGILVSRPTVAKIGALAAALATTPENERGTVMAKMGALRARLTIALRTVASLLAIAVLMMAVARYV